MSLSYVPPPEVFVAQVLRLFMGDRAVVDLGDVDRAVELAPEAVEEMRMLLDALLPGLEVVRQVRRQVAFEHGVHGFKGQVSIWRNSSGATALTGEFL